MRRRKKTKGKVLPADVGGRSRQRFSFPFSFFFRVRALKNEKVLVTDEGRSSESCSR